MSRRVLCLNSLDARDGSTYRLRALRDLLVGDGFHVRFLETERNAFVKLVMAKYGALFLPYDLLFTQKFNPITLTGMIAARIRFKPVVVDWDDFDVGLQGCPLKKAIAWFCEKIGPHLATRITTHSEAIRVRAEMVRPTTIVPQGFDAALFRPAPERRAEDRKRWNFSEGDCVVGHLCTFTTGGTLDLDAVLKSWTEPPLANAKFLLIGGGPMEEEIRAKVRNLGLEKRVTFTGLLPHSEIPAALNALDAGIVFMSDTPANLARVSFKVIEYLAMNVPVVGQVVGETAFRFGSMVTPAPAEILAKATAEVAARRTRTETAAAVKNQDWSLVAKGLVETVRAVLNRAP